MQPSSSIQEIWFLTSELEGQRASSFRQERWCKIFLDAGATLRIFNLRGAFAHSDVPVDSHAALQSFRKTALAQYTGPQSSVREGLAVRMLRRIKHLLLADLYLPSVIKLLLHTNRLLKARRERVVIMASSPPFSVAVVGALLKRWHGDKVVLAIDMRDAWALHNALGGIKPLKRLIERLSLRRADHVTTVSYGLAQEFEHWYGVKVGVMYNVATHYLDVPPAAKIDLTTVSGDIDANRKQLVYTGSTPEGHYDLQAIVGSMRELRARHSKAADALQLVFVGACDEVRREATRQGIVDGDIVFIKHLPHDVARSVQASAHALLFLAHFGPNNAGVVSTKLFEYLCLGQPVLPFSLHEGSDVDRLLRRYCGGVSLNTHTSAEIMQSLLTLVQDGPGFLPKLTDVQRVKELLDDYKAHAKTLLA